MKSVLISIQPKWCELIANGKKTVEVRKTRPKLDVPFKVYIYQTKKPVAVSFNGTGKHISEYDKTYYYNKRSGKVIGEFVCDSIEEIGYSPEMHGKYISDIIDLHKVTCIDFEQMFDYIADGWGYGWHISDLAIYDTPQELGEFYKMCPSFFKDEWENDDCLDCENPCGNGGKIYLKRPPQSWCYVEDLK